MRINFSPIKLKNQNPTEIQDCYIELLEDRLIYHVRFFAIEPVDENDSSLGESNVFNASKTVAMKSHIAGIEKAYTTSKRWGVYVMVSGFAGDIKVIFKTEDKANELWNHLNNWL